MYPQAIGVSSLDCYKGIIMDPSRSHDDRFSSETDNQQLRNKGINRRSANYEPTVKWNYSFIQSLPSEYMGETYGRHVQKLKEAARHIFNDEEITPITRLELIDTVERLGLGHQFQNEITRALDSIVTTNNLSFGQDDLYAISLYFRLLRRHGYQVSQDVFTGLNIGKISNITGNINDHVRDMLSLYEACYLALEGENILDEAKTITSKHLHDIISKENNLSENMAKQVRHSLALPLHWRMQKLEAWWYIDHISFVGEHTINCDLLELAKLDFNIVQATYQDDLKEISSWWENLGLVSELKFARNKPVEYFLWSVGMTSEPWHGNCRKAISKATAFVTTVDDIYDNYGTLEELELFTDAVDRWDTNAMKQLPHYMKKCYLALYNTINGIAYDILKDRQFDVIKYLKKAWGDFCKAHFVEAKWCYNNYTPTIEEYLKTACISIGGPLILIHAYFFVNQDITTEGLEHLLSCPELICASSTIFRLCNDFGSSKAEKERGDVTKSIQCYMNDNNVSEQVAHEQLRNLINETWKKMNKDVTADSPLFSKDFVETVTNLTRVAKFIYHYEDKYGHRDWEADKHVLALLVNPISLNN